MAREFHVDVDLKGALLLNGSAGSTGQIPYSAGPGAPAAWADPPAGGTGSVTIANSAADVLTASSGEISADDAGADKLVFWDDSAGKLTYLTLGTNLSITGTTLDAAGGGSGGVDTVISGMLF
jgi:hypothetical protein